MTQRNDGGPPPWKEFQCRVPLWMSGTPAGFCGEKAHGHQLPKNYLQQTRGLDDAPYCFGHACPKHGGPREDEIRIFQDGYTPEGRPMWCAVMPGFINLQESPAGFDGNAIRAVANLRAAITEAEGES